VVGWDVGSRWTAGPVQSLWAGLCSWRNRSFVLYGHQGESRCMGPLESHDDAAAAAAAAV
jgi:hypothetical protein